MDDALIDNLDDDTTLITSDEEHLSKAMQQLAQTNISAYDASNRMYSAYLNNDSSSSDLTLSLIEQLGTSPQTDLTKTMSIISIINKQINTNDLIGMVVQSIEDNINTQFKLVFNNFNGARNKQKVLQRAKDIINDFNKQIDINGFIAQSVNTAYTEGNYICVLRNSGSNWLIDYYPLGVAEISGYTQNGNPIVLVNMSNLKTALSKTMLKNRKNKPLFFKDTEDEIKNSYPKEVYDAYKNNETYAVLDSKYTGVVRTNNHGRKYGLSAIFRALPAVVMLNNFQDADASSAKFKAKKIIHQVMRKEILGSEGKELGYDAMAFAHGELMKAYRQKTVVYTSCPAVEKIVYVEPKTDEVSVDKVNIYRNKVLSSLGVSFLANDKSQTASTAKISLQQLIHCINHISQQVERILERFYAVVLEANGIGMEYCPSVSIIDSELLDADMRMELAKLLYGTFAASRQTCFEMVGVDVEDERVKREAEAENGLDDIFTPYGTSYTVSGDNAKGGRPADKNSNDPDKQTNDKEYNKVARN